MASKYVRRQFETDLATKSDLTEHRMETKAGLAEIPDTLNKIVEKSEARLAADRAEAENRLAADRIAAEKRLSTERQEFSYSLNKIVEKSEARLAADRAEAENRLAAERMASENRLASDRQEFEKRFKAERREALMTRLWIYANFVGIVAILLTLFINGT